MIPRKKSPKWAFQKNRKRIRRKGVKYVSTPIPGNVRKNIPIKHIIAPRNFSLLESRFEIIEFLRNIEEETQKGKYFSINLKGIKATDALTVSLLITIMMDSKTHIRRVVIPPKNSPARDIFEKANFRGTVTAKNLDKNYFMSRTDMKVNQKFTEEIIEFAKNRGVVDAEEVLNPILVEIFSNTNNHASIDDAIKVPWFISIAEQEEKLCFSVIDLGIGIYESLRTNKALKNISKKDHSIIEEMYNNKQSKYLASEIPNGICSSTKESSRGKGLKEIYERANNSTTCKKFVIISNKAMVNILNTKKTYYDSDHSFNGTAFYWEMQK